MRMREEQFEKEWFWFGGAILGMVAAYTVALGLLFFWLLIRGETGTQFPAVIAINDYVIPTPSFDDAPPKVELPEATDFVGDQVVTIARAAEPMVIDGDLDGWGDLPTVSSAFEVYSAESYSGDQDASAFWRTTWDDDNLYFSAVVVDDVHVQSLGQAVYRGDTLEVQLDTGLNSDGISPRTFTIVLSPGDFDQIAPHAFCLRGTAGGKLRSISGHNTQMAALETDSGYVIEAAIPWGDLGVKPRANWAARIALNVHDTDTEAHIRADIIQSNIPDRIATVPESWGALLLVD